MQRGAFLETEIGITLWDIARSLHIRTPENYIARGYYILVGAGGVGTWAALSLALMAPPPGPFGPLFKLVIIDHDKWEPHNFNRVPLPMYFVGKPKAESLAAHLSALRPHVYIEAVNEKADELLLVAKLSMMLNETSAEDITIIDATDNLDATRTIMRVAARLEVYYVGAHYDGTHITVEARPPGNIGLWETGDQRGYQVFPSLAPAAAIAGSLAAFLAITRPRKPVALVLDLGDLEQERRQGQG